MEKDRKLNQEKQKDFTDREGAAAFISQITGTLFKRDYEMVGVIYGNTRTFKVIHSERWYGKESMEPVNYDKELGNYYKSMKPEDARQLLDKIKLERVEEELKKHPIYSVEYDMYDEGENRRKQLRFTYDGKDLDVILVTRMDINDIMKKEREKQHQLEDALNLAEKANNAKSEFLSTISHEIRTPINVIMGMTQLAEEEKDNHEAVMGYIEEIRLSSRHLLNLVNNVLDMSKIESGEFSLHPQRYTFEELLKNVKTMFKRLCEKKNITFRTEEYGGQPDMLVDKMRLNQVIFNLMNNAVKYTEVGGEVAFTFLNQVREEEMDVKFLIQDTGAGMSKEFQEQMFKPFTQESNEVLVSSQGTGLGLSISKGIIDKMGGELSVSSVLGKGTTFCVCITMPIARERNAKQYEIPAEPEFDFTGRTILVVEDHNLNQMIIKKLLKKKGADVIVSANGKMGVEEFASREIGSIDAILMDIRMPVMDGLQASRAIRSLKREDARQVPIIAMTANAYDEDRQKSEAAGMNGHLAKPIDTKVLYETLEYSFGWQSQ